MAAIKDALTQCIDFREGEPIRRNRYKRQVNDIVEDCLRAKLKYQVTIMRRLDKIGNLQIHLKLTWVATALNPFQDSIDPAKKINRWHLITWWRIYPNILAIFERSNSDEIAHLSKSRLWTETQVSCAYWSGKSSLDPIQMASTLDIDTPDHAARLYRLWSLISFS